MAIAERTLVPAIQGQVIGFVAFSALVLINVFHHVPWRDEIQAFLIAKDSPDLVSLFHSLAYEGHPGLWHLILFPIVRLIDTPLALKLVQAPISCAILALLWLRSPFTLAEKLLLSAGYFFMLEYTVIARGYGLGVALFFAFVALRETPWAWLALGLMANTSIHFTALGGICGLLLIYRGNRHLPMMALCLAMALFGLFTAWPTPDAVVALSQGPTWARPLIALMRLSGALFPGGWGNYDELKHFVPSDVMWIARLTLGGLTIWAGARSLRHERPLRWAFLGVAAGLLFIGTFAYEGWDRHYGVLWIALIGFHWIAREERNYQSNIFRAWSVLSIASTAIAALPMLYGLPFTGGYQTAEWIKMNAPDAVIAAYPGSLATEVTPYFDHPVYNLQAQRWEMFTKWNYKADEIATPEQLDEWVRNAPKGRLLIITDPRGVDGSAAIDLSLGLTYAGYKVTLLREFDGAAFDSAIYEIQRK